MTEGSGGLKEVLLKDFLKKQLCEHLVLKDSNSRLSRLSACLWMAGLWQIRVPVASGFELAAGKILSLRACELKVTACRRDNTSAGKCRSCNAPPFRAGPNDHGVFLLQHPDPAMLQPFPETPGQRGRSCLCKFFRGSDCSTSGQPAPRYASGEALDAFWQGCCISIVQSGERILVSLNDPCSPPLRFHPRQV